MSSVMLLLILILPVVTGREVSKDISLLFLGPSSGAPARVHMGKVLKFGAEEARKGSLEFLLPGYNASIYYADTLVSVTFPLLLLNPYLLTGLCPIVSATAHSIWSSSACFQIEIVNFQPFDTLHKYLSPFHFMECEFVCIK